VGFTASNGYVHSFLKRYDIINVAMHGQAGATNLAAATAAVERIRRQLEAYPPDRIQKHGRDGVALPVSAVPVVRAPP